MRTASMRLHCARLLPLLSLAVGTDVYSKLEAGARCRDYLIPGVATKEVCFGVGAAAAGLSSKPTVQLNGIGFMGCVYNKDAGTLMFGTTIGVTEENTLALDNLEYICNGIPTTTTTTTNTMTTTTGLMHRLQGDQRCADFMVVDIANPDACFNQAAPLVGLAGKTTLHIDGIGFTGCVYNAAAGVLMYGETHGTGPDTTMTLPTFEYICSGIIQTSTSTTVTETTATQTTATTATTTITTLGPYARLSGGTACAAQGFPNVGSLDECFNMAGPMTDLSGKSTMELNGIGFTGCVYNSAAETLMWGVTSGVTPDSTYTLASWQYLCKRDAQVLYP